MYRITFRLLLDVDTSESWSSCFGAVFLGIERDLITSERKKRRQKRLHQPKSSNGQMTYWNPRSRSNGSLKRRCGGWDYGTKDGRSHDGGGTKLLERSYAMQRRVVLTGIDIRRRFWFNRQTGSPLLSFRVANRAKDAPERRLALAGYFHPEQP